MSFNDRALLITSVILVLLMLGVVWLWMFDISLKNQRLLALEEHVRLHNSEAATQADEEDGGVLWPLPDVFDDHPVVRCGG